MTKPKSDNLPATQDDDNDINDPVNITKGLDIRRALNLRMKNGLSYQAIGDKLGFHKTTIFKALKPFRALIKNPDQIAAYRENKATLIDSAQMELIGQIANKEKLKKATLGNVAYGISQLDNVARLERGQATANVNYHVLTESINELEAEEAKIQEEMKGN